MKRNANAVWEGSIKEGKGTFAVASAAIVATPYSFKTRFVDGTNGTNPEELVAAAHASCFSMAVAAQLGERGITPVSIETACEITFENKTLTASALTTTIAAPGADKAKVTEAAEAAKAGCPISRALKLDVTLALRVT